MENTINKKIWFPTVGFQGHINVAPSTLADYNKWMEIEKELTESSYGTTTHNGHQIPLNNSMKTPKWYETIYQDLTEARSALQPAVHKSTWVIDYTDGGFQDPHIHHVSDTLILNLSGQGELMLFDPRPMAVALVEPWAETIVLNPGDWITFPGWLAHSSRPCTGNRSILVMDFIL